MGRSIPRTSDRGRDRASAVWPTSHAPPGWTPHDDWVALLRLGRHLGASTLGRELSWETVGCLEGVDLLQWLMRWSTPQPLPLGDRRAGAESMLLH